MKQIVSIIIPVFNRANLVKRTLQSVLKQTVRPLEVVLVDNNSTDSSLDVLQKFKQQHNSSDFKVIVAQELQHGAAAARNCGARLSSGEWILFFDSDDTMEPDMIECYLAAAHQKNNAEMVLGRADITEFDGATHEKHYYTTDLLVNNIFHASVCPMQRCLTRRNLCERAGWWNPELKTWNDWDFTMRLLLANPVIAFFDKEIKVHIFLQRQSITGTDFASKAGTWEQAIDAVEQSINKTTNLPCRERLLKYIEFKRITLSGLYLGEKRRDLATPLYNQAYARIRHDCMARWLFPLLRKYIAVGGQGASHIVKCLIK